jgi:ketosteroid isomerase-like protein
MSRNREVLDRFYAAVQRKDVDEIVAAVDDGFAPDAVLRVSESLPYGGVVTGRDRIRTGLVALMTARTPIVVPESIEVRRVIEDGDQIAYEPHFDWLAPGASEPIRMSAVEWFTFTDGRVTEMTVGYWDTAACVRAMDAAKASQP